MRKKLSWALMFVWYVYHPSNQCNKGDNELYILYTSRSRGNSTEQQQGGTPLSFFHPPPSSFRLPSTISFPSPSHFSLLAPISLPNFPESHSSPPTFSPISTPSHFLLKLSLSLSLPFRSMSLLSLSPYPSHIPL